MTQSLSASFAILCAFLAFAAAQNPCPSDDWRFSPHNNKCYQLHNEKIGWTLAEFKCAMAGGHQVSITDATTNQFVNELARRVGVIWLGMAQFGTDPTYIWADGSPYSFEDWHAKHNYRKPIFHKGKKCAKLDSDTATWMQSCCKVPASYICQRKAVAVTTTQPPQPTEAPWWLQKAPIMPQQNELRRFRFSRL